MFVLTLGAAIPGVHTSFTRLETDAPLLAALGAAGVHLVHSTISHERIICCATYFLAGSSQEQRHSPIVTMAVYFSSFFAAFVTYCH
jgi:hypothetical protein